MIYLKWAAGSEISIKGDNLSWNLSLKHRVIRRNEIRRIVDHKNFVLIQSKSISIYIPKSSKAYAAVIDFVHLHPLGKNITSENNKPT